MSWLISRRLYESLHYSPEQAAEYLPATCSDGEQSAPSSTQPIPQAYCSPDRMTEFSRLSRFGMTFAPLTDARGAELLTSYLAGFHAKTFQAQEKAQELMGPGLGCGEKWHELSVKFDLDSCSWKTVHCLFPEDLPWSSVTLPRSGMIRNGFVYQRLNVVRTMSATDSGSLLPTPTCHNAREGAYPAEYTRNTPTLATHVGGKINPLFTEWMMGWPLGWTDLKPLETDRFHEWQQQHSACLPDSPQRETEGDGR